MVMQKSQGKRGGTVYTGKIVSYIIYPISLKLQRKGKDRISDLMWISGLDTQMSYKD